MAPSNSKTPTTLNPFLNILSQVAIFLIAAYQLLLSPLLGPRCRFYPSCSSYAKQAFKEQGFSRGSILTLKRLAKCHPFNKGGIDELPAEKNISRQFILWKDSDRSGKYRSCTN